MLSPRKKIRLASLAASRSALRVRGTGRRRARATTRDLGLLAAIYALLFYAAPGSAAWLQWAALVVAFVVSILIVSGGVTRRRVFASMGGWLCERLGLDAPSMACARRSQTATSRARSACEVFARAALALAADLTRRLTSLRLTTLGAITTTTQPRLATTLVAGFAAHSAA